MRKCRFKGLSDSARVDFMKRVTRPRGLHLGVPFPALLEETASVPGDTQPIELCVRTPRLMPRQREA